MTNLEPADMDIEAPGRPFWRNLSVIWLVPILALVVSLGVAWQSYSGRGELIEISFKDAGGVTAGETTLRYRDVVIGTVETIRFNGDLSKVIVSARVDQSVAPYLDESASFWVVRPQVTTRGISGLSTVLSGVYITGDWDTKVGTAKQRFDGKDIAPLVAPGRKGTRITLRGNDGNILSAGAPIIFKGIEVGRLEEPRLTDSGNSVLVGAFIDAPQDKRLTTATRFWDTSGFTVKFGAQGFALDVKSLSSLLAGGLEFADIYEGGQPIPDGYVYTIYVDEETARKSLANRTIADGVNLTIPFDDAISGLAVGAPVRFGGVQVGEVSAIVARAGANPDNPNGPVQLVANVVIDPVQMGMTGGSENGEMLDFFAGEVEKGLRAKLGTESLFSGALVVDLVRIENPTPAILRRDGQPYPILPSVPSEMSDFTATAEGVLKRINSLPIEELMTQTTELISSVNKIVSSESTQALPDEARAILSNVRTLIADDATQALPGELRAAVADLRSVVADLRSAGAIESLTSALKNADRIAANVATASDQFPQIVDQLHTLTEKVNALKADELVASAQALIDSANKLVDSDATRALPASLASALDEVQKILVDLREGGAISNVNATLDSARKAADSVASSVDKLPQLTDRLNTLLARADTVLSAYGERSDFNDETVATLREIRQAATAVSKLARTIERNPNSLLIGK